MSQMQPQTQAELEEWRNTGAGTVWLSRLSADGTRVQEAIVGQKPFLISPADRNSHTRSSSGHAADPFQNGTFFPMSDNAKAASEAMAARRPKPPAPPEAEPDPVEMLRAELAEQRLEMARLRHELSGSPEPFPEPEAPAVVERVPDPFEGKANPNVLDEGEMIELLTSPDHEMVGRWLATIDSAAALSNLLGRARAGAGSGMRQIQINDRLHQVDEFAPGLPGTTSAAGGQGDSAPTPSAVDLERLHVADEFDPSVGAPGAPRQTGVDSIAGDLVLASAPASNVPPPQPIPPHLAGYLPQN